MSHQAQLSERSSSTEDAGPLTPGGAWEIRVN